MKPNMKQKTRRTERCGGWSMFLLRNVQAIYRYRRPSRKLKFQSSRKNIGTNEKHVPGQNCKTMFFSWGSGLCLQTHPFPPGGQ